MIKVGRIDIISEVSLLSSQIALPRERHLDASVHVGHMYNSRLVYDPSYPEIKHSVIKKCDWSEFCRDPKEGMPMNTAEP